MRSNQFSKLFLGLSLGIFLCGCGQTSVVENNADSPSGNESGLNDIAVVDINMVAEQIGAMDKIRLSMAEFELDLKSRLAELKDQLDEKFESKKAVIDNDMNKQGKGELDIMLVKHQDSLNQQTALANNQLAAHHNKLKMKLMNQVRPVAYEIASEKGMSMVLTTAQIYAAGPSSDITESVIKRIQKLNAQMEVQEKTEPAPRVADLPGGDSAVLADLNPGIGCAQAKVTCKSYLGQTLRIAGWSSWAGKVK